VSSDQNGNYKISSIIPGNYSLIAFHGLGDMTEAQDPELFQQHSSKAITLEVKSGAAESKALKAIALEQNQQ
jgi:hypothetical protein